MNRLVLVGMTVLAVTLVPFAASAQSAYDLEQLHPDVRAAAAAARAIETPARQAATRAREAEAQAEDAAQRARRGEDGYGVGSRDDDPQLRRYEGQRSSNGGQELGILTFDAGEFEGDRYAGEFSCGRKHGFGVYRYAAMRGRESHFEGGYEDDRRSGLGSSYARDGAYYVGEVDAQGMRGVGVHYSANGWRYEGEFADNRPNGYGVLWNERGRVQRAGIFHNARLVTRLTRNATSRRVVAVESEPEPNRLTCAASGSRE
jgi:hypothetical protein